LRYLHDKRLEATHPIASKEVVPWQIEDAMLKDNITKAETGRIGNSRTALNRLLDPPTTLHRSGVIVPRA
jgi:hypothetical protein